MEYVIVAAIFAWAVYYVWKKFRPNKGSSNSCSCGGGCACGDLKNSSPPCCAGGGEPPAGPERKTPPAAGGNGSGKTNDPTRPN
ncbi:hypothetical protein AAU61_17450 [Desulfocarbo indianensis]|nr:hypothetical protein AAU61_17450 [Desulfocarbo indianensis]